MLYDPVQSPAVRCRGNRVIPLSEQAHNLSSRVCAAPETHQLGKAECFLVLD